MSDAENKRRRGSVLSDLRFAKSINDTRASEWIGYLLTEAGVRDDTAKGPVDDDLRPFVDDAEFKALARKA